MERTKQNNQEKQQLALEAFGSESFLSINKKLLSHFGPNLTVYVGNLIDKMKYFSSKGKLGEDNSFFLTQANQAIQTGMSEYQLRKCKNKLKKIGVLTTQMRGIPPKEFYILHIDVLVEEFLRNIPLVFRGFNLKKLKDSPSKNLRNIKETVYKETECKENNIYLSDLKRSDNMNGENIPSINNKENKPSINNKENKPSINNKENKPSINNKENKPSINNKENKPSIKERNKQYLPIVKKLSSIIQQTKKMKHTPNQLRSWSNEVRQLVEGNGIPPDRINMALDWYEEHIGGEYVPVIESGGSLREKFVKLENAMQRGNNNKNKKSPSRNNKYQGTDYARFTRAEKARAEREQKEAQL